MTMTMAMAMFAFCLLSPPRRNYIALFCGVALLCLLNDVVFVF